jgi:hypothetical protein
MTNKSKLAIGLAVALTLVFGPSALAADEWKFGLGTGFSALSLDGDIGFETSAGTFVGDVDLDNSDTQDMFESGFGFAGYAAKGKWKIHYAIGTLTLEDSDAGVKAEWDRIQAEVATVYNFAKTGNHNWGALFGVRNMDHEWKITGAAVETINIDESWTDGLVGLTHGVPFSDKWSWSTRLDAGFGDSEGTTMFVTGINWHVGSHWIFNLNAKLTAIEFENGDPGDADYYLYDVDETTVGIGFLYNF